MGNGRWFGDTTSLDGPGSGAHHDSPGTVNHVLWNPPTRAISPVNLMIAANLVLFRRTFCAVAPKERQDWDSILKKSMAWCKEVAVAARSSEVADISSAAAAFF